MTVHEREDAIVARLHTLAPHLDGEPDPAFRAATRARMVAMAAVRTPAPEPASPLRRLFARAEDVAASRWRSRLTAGLAGAALTVTALASLVAVSTTAGPGDVLYSLKRGAEETQLALAGDARGQVLLDLARTRLHELEDLAESGTSALPAPAAPATSDGMGVSAAGVDDSLVLETLKTMDEQTIEGSAWMTHQAVTTGDDDLLVELATWSKDQTAGLTALREELPASTLDELGESLGLLGDIDTRTVALAGALDCASGPPIESTDALGPVPGLCMPDPVTPPVAGGESGQPGSDPHRGPSPRRARRRPVAPRFLATRAPACPVHRAAVTAAARAFRSRTCRAARRRRAELPACRRSRCRRCPRRRSRSRTCPAARPRPPVRPARAARRRRLRRCCPASRSRRSSTADRL